MSIYSNLPHETLSKLVETNTQKYIDAKLAGSLNEEALQKLASEISEIQSALATKTPVCNPVAQNQTQAPNYEMNRRLRELSDYFSKITEFGPGQNVTLFIKECDRIYNIVVSDCKDLEKDFCRRVRMQLCSDYATDANNHHATDPLDTFEKLKSFLRQKYEDQLSAYQHFQKLDSMERGSSESVSDFARRVQSTSLDIRSVIFEKFKRHQSKVVKQETVGTDSMSASELMDFISGQIVLRSLRNDREAFNHIVDELDVCWNAQDIATRAAGFIGRRVKNDALFSDSGPKVNFANNRQESHKRANQNKNANRKKSDRPCKGMILYDTCQFGEKCWSSHDKQVILAEKKILREKLNGQQNSDNKGRKPWKKSAKVNHAQGDEETSADLGQYSVLSDFQQ